jgi:dTDP-glucose 4,6-dehydratase
MIEKIIQTVINKQTWPNLNNKKVLIAGGTGLIGLHMATFFNILGADVTSIYNKDIPEYFEKYLPAVDMLQLNLVKGFCYTKKFDYIIFAAGTAVPSKFIKDPLSTIAINTSCINDFVKNLAPDGKFLFMSSDAIYSGCTDEIFTENSVGKSDLTDPRSSYIESKKIGEILTKIHGGIIARISYVVGSGCKLDDTRVVNSFIMSALTKGEIVLMDGGSAMRSWLPVQNAICMLLNILFFGKSGEVYNVSNVKENAISIYDLAKIIANLTNVPMRIEYSKNTVSSSAPFSPFLSIQKYEKKFGPCKFEKLKDVLKDTIDWYKNII